MDRHPNDLIPLSAVSRILRERHGLAIPHETIKHLFWRGKAPCPAWRGAAGGSLPRIEVRESDVPAIAWHFVGRYLTADRAQRVASALDLPLAA